MWKCKSCMAPFNLSDASRLRCGYCGAFIAQNGTLLSNLCIETVGDMASIIIPKQTIIPYVLSEVFSTANDNQSSIQIHLVQGDNELASKNRSVAKLRFEVAPPEPRGVPQIEVFFSISLNGELKVTAKNLKTKNLEEFPSLFLAVI
jgi:molecular chaperone DnaK (HSP70)